MAVQFWLPQLRRARLVEQVAAVVSSSAQAVDLSCYHRRCETVAVTKGYLSLTQKNPPMCRSILVYLQMHDHAYSHYIAFMSIPPMGWKLVSYPILGIYF